MEEKQKLLDRLDSIAKSLEDTGKGVALIGLGSVGAETERLDDYSDLDFFAVVRQGEKTTLLNDLSWLNACNPIVYAFRNTVDGYKVLFQDEIFAEFAVFELHELSQVPYSEGRLVWAAPGTDTNIRISSVPYPSPSEKTAEWRIGEILTNLYNGLGRYLRGEKLSAMRFVQSYAVDRIIEMANLLDDEQPAFPDPFTSERRFEQRFPGLSAHLASFMQGYNRTPESALAILSFLELHFDINPMMKAAILNRIDSLPQHIHINE